MATIAGALEASTRRRRRRAVAAVALVVAAGLLAGPTAAATAAPASAPVPLLPAGGVPGGFTHVVAIVPVTPKGRLIAGTSNGVAGRLVVPPASLPSGTDVLITVPALSKIPASAIKAPARQRTLRPIYGLGVLFQRRGHRVANGKPVALRFTAKRFSRADYVVVYYAAHHAFVPVRKNHARCVTGQCLVKFTAGSEVLVLGP